MASATEVRSVLLRISLFTMVCEMKTLGGVIAERELDEGLEKSSAAPHPWRGRGCCWVGAVALAFSFVPLATSPPPSPCRLWLGEKGEKNTLTTPQEFLIRQQTLFFFSSTVLLKEHSLPRLCALVLSEKTLFTLFSLLPSFIWGSSSPSPWESQPRKQSRRVCGEAMWRERV